MTAGADIGGLANSSIAGICAALAQTSVRYRWLVITICIVLTLVGALGAISFRFDPDSRVYFSRDAPERIAFEAIGERYGNRRDVIALVRGAGANADVTVEPLRAAAAAIMADLAELEDVAAAGEALPGGDPGVIIREVRGRPPVAVFGITVTATSATSWAMMNRLQAAADDAARRAGAYEVLFTGEPAQEAASMTAIRNDLGVYVPMEVAIIVVLLLIALGSLTATLALLSVLSVAVAATMGGHAWTGAVLNGVTSVVPSSLLGLSVATSVHIILGWQHGLRRDMTSEAALMRSVRLNAKPVALATVTTILSFLCLNFADSPAFHTFGNLVAIGLVLTLTLSFTLLPAVISLLPANPVPARAGFERFMAEIGATVCAWRLGLVALALVALVFSAIGLTHIVFRDTFVAYFDDRYSFRQATVLYEERAGGVSAVDVSVPVAAGEAITDPSYLADIANFTLWAQSQPHVSAVVSLASILEDAGRTVGLGDLDRMRRGEGVPRPFTQQVLSNGNDPGLQTMLGQGFAEEAPGEGATRVIVVLRGVHSGDILDFAAAAEAELARLGEARSAIATGLPVLAANLSKRNGEAMVKATPFALVAISLLLVVALGSWRLGLISLVPNLMPLLMAYGLWGFVMGELTFAGTMVIAMTFGIVVDDTVHMMSRYRHLRLTGARPVPAMIETFRTVGIAVVVTTLAIASGFSVLSLSGFIVNRDLGMITAMTLVGALIATLLFLPALLVLIDRRRSGRALARASTGP